MHLLYNLLLILSGLVLMPYYGFRMLVTGKYRQSLGAKLGLVPEAFFSAWTGTPRIWIHAVSVGEVTAAAPIVAALRERYPQACLLVSTSTETGQEMARRIVAEATGFFYYPLDLPWVIRRTLDRVRPDLVALTETELWPNLLHQCRERGIPVVMVNGRISPRSFRKYHRSRFFWKAVLRDVRGMGMISETDAGRIAAIGMARSRIQVLGNAKYDGLAARVAPALQEEMAQRLDIAPGTLVLVAGSTHSGEEDIVMAVYRRLRERYSGLILILVPRHVHRAVEVMDRILRQGDTEVIALSRLNAGERREQRRIVVVDVIGELFKVYSLASAVYCGGSLVPRGGQNILEPAAWGKVIFFGPSMEDFENERALLEEIGAGIAVQGESDLYDGMLRMLEDVSLREGLERAAAAAVAANRGAAARHADLIAAALTEGRQ